MWYFECMQVGHRSLASVFCIALSSVVCVQKTLPSSGALSVWEKGALHSAMNAALVSSQTVAAQHARQAQCWSRGQKRGCASSPQLCVPVTHSSCTTSTSTSSSTTTTSSSSSRPRLRCARAFDSDKQPTAVDSLEDLEIAVPVDQRPVNELASLKEAFLYNWATLPLNAYLTKVALVFGVFFAFVGAPIANQTFDPHKQPFEFALSATTGSLLVVAVLMLRIYLGWAYVQDRLRSAAVPYEETGWYDGQVFVKPPEVLTRDRLLASYQVRPVLTKLRQTLLGAGVVLLTSSVLLVGLIRSDTDEDGVYGRGSGQPVPRQVTADGVLFGKRVKDLSQLANDDELAAEEAEAQAGIPGYCADRLLRAYAGGQYCSKFER